MVNWSSTKVTCTGADCIPAGNCSLTKYRPAMLISSASSRVQKMRALALEIRNQAMSTAVSLLQTRSLAVVQQSVTPSKPLLVILVFWLTINFISIGMFAPRNEVPRKSSPA